MKLNKIAIISLISLFSISTFAASTIKQEEEMKKVDNVLSVSKIKIDIPKGQKSEFFTITNKNQKEAVGYSVDIMKWSMKDNKNVYEETDNIILTPKTFVLQPNQYKNIRLMANDYNKAVEDYSYRVIISQISRKELKTDDESLNKIKINFTVTVPVFFYSEKFKEHDKVNIVKTLKGNVLELKNEDTQYVYFKSVLVDGKEYNKNWYLLPNNTFEINLDKTNFEKVEIKTDRGIFEK